MRRLEDNQILNHLNLNVNISLNTNTYFSISNYSFKRVLFSKGMDTFDNWISYQMSWLQIGFFHVYIVRFEIIFDPIRVV